MFAASLTVRTQPLACTISATPAAPIGPRSIAGTRRTKVRGLVVTSHRDAGVTRWLEHAPPVPTRLFLGQLSAGRRSTRHFYAERPQGDANRIYCHRGGGAAVAGTRQNTLPKRVR